MEDYDRGQAEKWGQPPPDYQPPQAPPARKIPPLLWAVIIGTLFGCVCFGSALLASSYHASTQDTNAAATQTQSIADQVKKAFDAYTDPPIITSYSPDSFLVEITVTGDQAGEAETIATAVSLASDYQKTAWQANIDGLSSITVTIVQAEYPVDGVLTNQDLVKCIVTSATGTSLDWNSGTPAQRFQQFDVKWTLGQGVEP